MDDADQLVSIYTRIKQAKEAELARLISILKAKADDDPEIQHVIDVLERWSRS